MDLTPRPLLMDDELRLWIAEQVVERTTIRIVASAPQNYRFIDRTTSTGPIPEYTGSPVFSAVTASARRV